MTVMNDEDVVSWFNDNVSNSDDVNYKKGEKDLRTD